MYVKLQFPLQYDGKTLLVMRFVVWTIMLRYLVVGTPVAVSWSWYSCYSCGWRRLQTRAKWRSTSHTWVVARWPSREEQPRLCNIYLISCLYLSLLYLYLLLIITRLYSATRCLFLIPEIFSFYLRLLRETRRIIIAWVSRILFVSSEETRAFKPEMQDWILLAELLR